MLKSIIWPDTDNHNINLLSFGFIVNEICLHDSTISDKKCLLICFLGQIIDFN